MGNYTLFDCVYRTMREMGVLIEGTATGGSTNTIADSVDRTESDDAWNGGTAFIIYDAAGAGAAPQGEFDQISDFANTGGVITVRNGFSTAVAAGDRYAIAKKKYPLQFIRQCVNRALQSLGSIPITDTTSITTEDNKTEYNLPQTPIDLRQVYIQTNDDDADDNQWFLLHNWTEMVTATGTANILILPIQPESGYALKLVYGANHPDLITYNDKLSEEVPIERVIYTAARLALQDKMMEIDPIIQQRINNLRRRELEVQSYFPIHNILPPRTGKIILSYFDDTTRDDEPNKVYL